MGDNRFYKQQLEEDPLSCIKVAYQVKMKLVIFIYSSSRMSSLTYYQKEPDPIDA